MINDSNAQLIITDEDGMNTLQNINVKKYLIKDIEKYRTSEVLAPAETDWDDLCQLQYTSGTTGKPKGSMLTHGNWYTAIHNECDVLSLKQNDIFLGIYPMAHVGISWSLSSLRSGALYIMVSKYNLEEYLEICENEKVTVLSGMPPVIHSLTSLEDEKVSKLKTVREIISGGGPLHKKIWKTFCKKFKIPIINAYGLSETIVIGTGTAIRSEDYISADKYESVGHPVCFSQVKIVDVDDPQKELEKYENGEIALRGPGVSKGYWNNKKETKKAFLNDGWFLTGDIGYIDSDNRLFITDRKKDMIVMSGWKIYPTEVEEELIKHPSVKEIAIFGIDDCHSGEIPIAAIVWKDKENSEDLIKFAKENLGRYKVPRKIISLNELPRVNGWKLLRKDLKEKFNEI